MENPRQKFYYKLCIVSNGKFYCYMQRSYEFCIGSTVTQDISSPSPYLYVYKTPEMAISSEIPYTSKDLLGKLSAKTVLKLMCWGTCIETPKKFAFSNMCIIENIGFQKDPTAVRNTSKMRGIKNTIPRREVSPRSIKVARDNSPVRIYNSVISRKRSPVSYIQKFRPNDKVQKLLQKMKEETEKIDKEVKDIEKWNQFGDMEDIETLNSSDNLEI